MISLVLQGPLLQLEVEGSGFLYRQVRNMVFNISCDLNFSTRQWCFLVPLSITLDSSRTLLASFFVYINKLGS